MGDTQGDWVLVTGAGGFIGSHLVEELVRRGSRVRAFLHYNSRGDRGLLERLPERIVEEIDIVFGDLRDTETVGRAANGVRTLFHLGALIGIPYSYVSPRDVLETNVMGTLNVLEAARQQGVERVIHTSTSEVYGTARYVPIDENHPLQGQSPYSASKIGAEQLAISFHRSFGLGVTVVRPFNTYGPRQSTRAIVPTVITQALSEDRLRLGSTRPTRDLVFVADTAAGFISIAQSDRTRGEVVNIGTGSDISIGELVHRVGVILGRELVVEEDSNRVRPASSEVDRLVADASKCKQLCGWLPAVPLDEGLVRTIEWLRDNLTLYRPRAYAV